MFTSISVQVERQETPAGKKAGRTCREIYRTAGQLSRREKNATLAFTSNPISPGSNNYSLFGKIGVLFGTRLQFQYKK